MPGSFTLCFMIPGYPGLATMAGRGLDQFETIVGLISQLARDQAMSIQVDLQAAPHGADDPLLIQFLVGGDDRSSLLWHEDGVGFAAVDPYLPQRPYGIEFTRGREIECAPPGETQVRQATVGDALAVYLLTGERTKWLGWREIPAD